MNEDSRRERRSQQPGEGPMIKVSEKGKGEMYALTRKKKALTQHRSRRGYIKEKKGKGAPNCGAEKKKISLGGKGVLASE